MSFKKAYFYLYYRLYKFYDSDMGFKWGTKWKASLSMDVLHYWLLLSFMVYYKVFTTKDLFSVQMKTPVILIAVLFVAGINYFIFDHGREWKKHFREFDKWPKSKNRVGAAIAWLIVLSILGNMVFSFYLLSKIDWELYR